MKTKLIVFIFFLVLKTSTLFAQHKNEIFFLENVGQIHDQHGKPRKDIDFVLHATNGLNIFISRNKISYQFAQGNNIQRVEACLIGSSAAAKDLATEKQVYYENHYHNSKLIGRAQSYK